MDKMPIARFFNHQGRRKKVGKKVGKKEQIMKKGVIVSATFSVPGEGKHVMILAVSGDCMYLHVGCEGAAFWRE